MKLRRIARGGRHFRVADPSWENPLDGRFSQRHGGRWNAAGSFPVVYLNASLAVARANVLQRLQGLPYGPEDLDPAAAPVLVTTGVAEDDFIDIVTAHGCRAAGLPTTYPQVDGETVGWQECQPIGQRAWEEEAPGIACRSAAPGLGPADEELAWFERARPLQADAVQRFEDWFWPTGTLPRPQDRS